MKNLRTITVMAVAVVQTAAAAGLFVGSQTTGQASERSLGRIPDGVAAAVASEDGLHVAYVAREGIRWLVVVDGPPGPEYDTILQGNPVFNPDGRRVAYAARKNDKQFLVVDGRPGPECAGIVEGSLAFSPDGRRVAYLARKDGVEHGHHDAGPHTIAEPRS